MTLVSRPGTASASVTRPSDTTTYAAGDAVTNSTSAPTVITFDAVGLREGAGGWVTGAVLVDSANVSTKGQFELWLFDQTVTPDNDNAVFTPTDAECSTLVGVIPFSASYVGDATSGAGGNAVYPVTGLNIPFRCLAGDDNLYGLLVVRNAYVPVSGEIFTVRLSLLRDG